MDIHAYGIDMDIEKRVSQKVQSLLEKWSSSILTVNAEAFSEPSKQKEIRKTEFADRIPSKKFDLVVLNLNNAIDSDTPDELRIEKYLSKSNKYSLINTAEVSVNNLTDKYPHVYINFNKSPIFIYYQAFLELIKNYPEFNKIKHDVQTHINHNFLRLGFVYLDQEESDLLVCFKNNELKKEFEEYFNSKNDIAIHESFYPYILNKYASGIDNRNLRFKNNTKYLLGMTSKKFKKGINSIANILNKTSSLSLTIAKRGTQSVKSINKILPKTTPKVLPETVNNTGSDVNNSLEESITHKNKSIFDILIFQIDSIKAKIFLRNLPQHKLVSYDDMASGKRNSILSKYSQQRSLQKLKNKIKFSLIMIVSDIDEIWLNKTVRSIKDQVYTNWEFIIIDNCSSRTYLKSYLSSLNDPRVRTYFFNTRKTFSECLSYGVYKMSKGDFIGVIEEGDELDIHTFLISAQQIEKDPKVDLIYSDEDMISEQGKRIHPFFKPNWDNVLITSYPYIKNIFFVKKELIDRIDAFHSYTLKDPLWDLFLRVKESTENIEHIGKTLYHRRIRPLKKEDDHIYIPEALKGYIDRETLQSSVVPSSYPKSFAMIKKHTNQLKVSIIIFEKNLDSLEQFLNTFNPIHQNIEILIGTEKQPPKINSKFQLMFFKVSEFCFAREANRLAEAATGEYLLFYDTRLRTSSPDFIERMISYSDNGITGTKIIDPDSIIEQGIFVKRYGKPIGTLMEGVIDTNQFYTGVTKQCLAVSKKCMMIKREAFLNIKFDNQLKKSYQDIDLCLNAHKQNLQVTYVPDAKQISTYAYSKETFNERDTIYFIKKWGNELLEEDPYINHLQLSIKTN